MSDYSSFGWKVSKKTQISRRSYRYRSFMGSPTTISRLCKGNVKYPPFYVGGISHRNKRECIFGSVEKMAKVSAT